MLISLLAGLFSNDLAIDLGTANTLVYVRGEGIVMNEPSIVAIHQADHSVLAVGHEAKAMLGRTPGNITAIRPLKDGVIADFDVTEKMLHYFINKVHRRRTLVHPRIVIGVPSGITQVEKRAVRDSAMQAGAREVYLIEEPMAAAIGAGLPIQEPGGNMIVDMGGGTTEVAVISLSGIVYSKSVRIAGDEMDEAIVQYIKKHYNLLVGERRAEEIKIKLGSAYPMGGERMTMEVKGRDLIDGIPKTIVVTDEEIREALREPVMAIVDTVRTCLERTPPELAADIVDKGIVLTGGGAMLANMDTVLRQATGLPVSVAEDPLLCVALGTGHAVENIDRLRGVLSSMY
jgi:rod shape-determining protein MreB